MNIAHRRDRLKAQTDVPAEDDLEALADGVLAMHVNLPRNALTAEVARLRAPGGWSA